MLGFEYIIDISCASPVFVDVQTWIYIINRIVCGFRLLSWQLGNMSYMDGTFYLIGYSNINFMFGFNVVIHYIIRLKMTHCNVK